MYDPQYHTYFLAGCMLPVDYMYLFYKTVIVLRNWRSSPVVSLYVSWHNIDGYLLYYTYAHSGSNGATICPLMCIFGTVHVPRDIVRFAVCHVPFQGTIFSYYGLLEMHQKHAQVFFNHLCSYFSLAADETDYSLILISASTFIVTVYYCCLAKHEIVEHFWRAYSKSSYESMHTTS